MKFMHIAGRVAQAVGLGTLLFLAIVKMAAMNSGARVFFYQGF